MEILGYKLSNGHSIEKTNIFSCNVHIKALSFYIYRLIRGGLKYVSKDCFVYIKKMKNKALHSSLAFDIFLFNDIAVDLHIIEIKD